MKDESPSIKAAYKRKSFFESQIRRPIIAPTAIPTKKLPSVCANVSGRLAVAKPKTLIQMISCEREIAPVNKASIKAIIWICLFNNMLICWLPMIFN